MTAFGQVHLTRRQVGARVAPETGEVLAGGQRLELEVALLAVGGPHRADRARA